MSRLITTYAKTTGLKVGKPDVKEHFYPAPFQKYITIQTGSGQGAKNYDLFGEVLLLLKPLLDAAEITIIHLGGKDDPALAGVYDLRGKTTIQQSNFIIKRTLCHLGNDSWLAHCAGWNYRPLVALYGSTAVGPHGPYWNDVATTILLESHRWGGKPTFASQEAQKAINVIAPETVANAVLKLLGLPPLIPSRKSLLFGPLYQHTIFELVPDSFPNTQFAPGAVITVRMDYLFDETNLTGLLSTGRKVNVVTKQPIKTELLNQFRQSILSYSHEIDAGDETSLDYIKTVKALVPKTTFFTKEKDEAKLSEMRFRLFDVANIEQVTDLTKSDAVNWALDYLNLPQNDANRLDIATQLCQARVKSNKLLLAGGSIYYSHAHFKAKKNAANQGVAVEVVDDPDFWRDLNHVYAYTETS